jgi:hypothetical protein
VTLVTFGNYKIGERSSFVEEKPSDARSSAGDDKERPPLGGSSFREPSFTDEVIEEANCYNVNGGYFFT